MKILVQICRFIVAVTFLFSGFVKLVDPIGTAIKLKEYFSADVLNLEFLIPYALPLGIALILFEIILGLFLFLGNLPKLTVWGTFGIMLVFLFLTWYSAYYNKVTDCGCFGDAVKLSTWGTFYKNVVFITLIIFLLLGVKHIKPIFSPIIGKWLSFMSIFTFLYIIYYVLIHLPIIDFRPYAIGNNIPEGMEYKDNSDEEPPIHDFFLENKEGNDVTDEVLKSDNVLLFISYNLSKSDKEGIEITKNIVEKAKKNGFITYALTASTIEEFTKLGLPLEMLFCDETTLKTMIRANPGFMTLHKGTVTGKWNWIDAESIPFENLKK
ncbi:MAG: DoxX family membrane protein [Flavobacteriaceae bacterium]|nr:DoxX family membrane protein [Flavobacteriaceae bacterium]